MTDDWTNWPKYDGWCAGMNDSRDFLRYLELARAYVLVVLKRDWR